MKTSKISWIFLIGQVNEVMKQKKLSIVLRPEVRKWIVNKTCHDRSYGARPLRRAIQRYVEDPCRKESSRNESDPIPRLRSFFKDDDLYFIHSGEPVVTGEKLG